MKHLKIPMDKRYTILIVEDDPEIRNVYVELFQSAKFEVREAEDGVAGLKSVVEKKPDIIFTGIMMPNMDGFVFMEALKNDAEMSSVPVVFSSHLGKKEDEEKAKALGVRKFLVRGMLSLNEVVEEVRSILETIEYTVAIDPKGYDSERLSKDFSFNSDFLCGENNEKKVVLRLTVKDASAKTFDAQLICE